MQPPPKGQFQAGVPVQQASGYDPKAQAIGNLGQSVKQTGDLALELQKEQDRQYLTDAEIIMRREAGRIANELATTMDPTKHYSKAKDKFDSVVDGILQKGDFRPSFQNELQGRLNMFTSAKLEKIAHDAKVMQLENGKMLHIAKAKSFQADGDFDGARNVLDEGVGTYWPEEYAKAKKLEIDRMERNEELYVIAKEGKPELFDKEEFKSESDRDKWKSIAKEQNRKTTIAKADQVFEDIIGGKDITVEDIEKMEDLKPSVRQKLKNTILDLHDDEMRQMMKDPAYRDQVRGEVAAMIANYNPSGEDFDNDFVEIRNKIELLPSGPLKSEFIGQLGNIRAGKEREIKDVRDWTMAQVDEAYKEGKLGVKAPEEPKGRTLKSYLASGDLLRNKDNLVKFGFKDDHAAKIVKAAIAEDEKDKTYKGQSSEYLFQKYYYDGGEATEDYSYKLRAAYEALIGGDGPSAVVIDPVDQKAYESKVQDFENDSFGMYGRAKSEVADFLKMNPSPSMGEATEFLKGLKVDIEAGATNSDWLKDKPGEGGVSGPRGARASGNPSASDVTSFVKGFEGWNPRAYWDYGQTSIGYGTRAKPGEGSIGRVEAENRLRKELSKHRKRVDAMNKKGGYDFTPAQIDALTSFDYNTGKLEQLTANGTRSIREIASKIPAYRKAGGEVLNGLVRRRKAEQNLFLNGY